MLRVLVVDDSAFMRRAICRMLQSEPGIEVVGYAPNGREGVEMATRLRPDVITMDIEMPVMDGLTALRHIMGHAPTQVIVVSSLTTEGSRSALRALSLGAADVLAKDASQVSLSIDALRDDLLARVKALGASRRNRFSPAVVAASSSVPTFRQGQFDLVCIGSSTGGPPVLETILQRLPAGLEVPIVIAQHMPGVFTASMAQRLGQICKLRVVHAEDGMPIERRTVYVAPGGRHTHVVRHGLVRRSIRVDDKPAEALYRPSVDALLGSAAEACGPRVLGAILTGMGNDGFEGAKLLCGRGGTLLAQSQETCVVYGMPKGVTEQGLASASLHPVAIAQALSSLAIQVPAIFTRPAPSLV